MSRVGIRYLRRFASSLGWNRLRCRFHIIHNTSGKLGKKPRYRVTWYEAGTLYRISLLINVLPCWSAMVWAAHYQLCSGWHIVDVSLPPEEAARRLSKWLCRDWFAEAINRSQYQIAHPECVHTSAPDPPPYLIEKRRAGKSFKFVQVRSSSFRLPKKWTFDDLWEQ